MRHFFTTFLLLLSGAIAVAQPEVGRFSITPKIGGSMCTMTGHPSIEAQMHMETVTPTSTSNRDFNGIFFNHGRIRPGWMGEVDVQYQLTERSGISVGIGYNVQGMKLKKDNSLIVPGVISADGQDRYCKFKNMRLTLGYLTVPVMYNMHIYNGLSAGIGLQAGFCVTRKMHFEALFDNTYYMKSQPMHPRSHFRWDEPNRMTRIEIDWCAIDTRHIQKFVLSAPVNLSYEWHRYVAELRYCIDLTETTDWTTNKKDGIKSWTESAHSRNSVLSLTIGYRFQL